MKKDLRVLTQRKPVAFKGGKWTFENQVSTVRVMAIAEKYAMVRYTGCIPFVVSLKDLSNDKIN